MTPLIVCADDFALHDAGDAAIVELAGEQRLSATSCLVLSPHWPSAARRLTPSIRHQIDVGLHLDFTEFDTPFPLRPLIFMSGCRRLNRRTLRERIARQCDAFENATGTPPDYVDGHQHVHQLPQIREVLLEELARRYPVRPWLRISNPAPGHGFKGALIRTLGASALRKAAVMAGFRHSRQLLGIYGFDRNPDQYREKMEQWTMAARAGDALMIHPANAVIPDDPIGNARMVEYCFFKGLQWRELLGARQLQIVRGSGSL